MRDGGRESFEAAPARQQTMVRNAFLLTGDFQSAEDLVQEALVRAAQRWDVSEDGNPDAWVRGCVGADGHLPPTRVLAGKEGPLLAAVRQH